MNHNQSSKTVLRIIRGGCLLLIVDVRALSSIHSIILHTTYNIHTTLSKFVAENLYRMCGWVGIGIGWFQVGQREDQRIRGRKLQTKALDVFLKVSSHA